MLVGSSQLHHATQPPELTIVPEARAIRECQQGGHLFLAGHTLLARSDIERYGGNCSKK